MTDHENNDHQPGTIDAQYEEITGSREIVAARPESFRPPVARDRQTQMAIWRESLDMALDQRAIIQEAMKSFLVLGKHYGPMPGAKPDGKDKDGNPMYSRMVLFKPGADAICAFFRLVPEFKIEREFLPGGHLNVIATCPLRNGNGDIVANGMGSCSTMEKKYRWRNAEMPCPNCGQPLRKSQFGPEFYCNAKAGGCGAKIHEDDPKVANFHAGKVENPDLADIYNTVIKMAAKRAQVDATLRGTNCADVFTQDLEDLSSRLDDNAAEQPARPNGKPKADPAPQKRTQAGQPPEAWPQEPPREANGGIAELMDLLSLAHNEENRRSLSGYIKKVVADGNAKGGKHDFQSVIQRAFKNPEKFANSYFAAREKMDGPPPEATAGPPWDDYGDGDGGAPPDQAMDQEQPQAAPPDGPARPPAQPADGRKFTAHSQPDGSTYYAIDEGPGMSDAEKADAMESEFIESVKEYLIDHGMDLAKEAERYWPLHPWDKWDYETWVKFDRQVRAKG